MGKFIKLSEYGMEGKMAKYDAKEIAEDAMQIFQMIDEEDNLPEWVEAKITMSAHNMDAVKEYLMHHFEKGAEVNAAGNYTKPEMRKRIFQRIKSGGKGGNPGQWSARKAQMLAKAYKSAGGGYTKKASQDTNLSAKENQFVNKRTKKDVKMGTKYHMHPKKGPMEGKVHNPDIPGGTKGHDYFVEKKANYIMKKIAKDSRLERAGVKGFNKPKRTPNHPTKSHIVVAKQGNTIKTIRFGQQGKSVGTLSGTAGKPKKGESARMKAKRKSFKARHGKNIAKGKMSAAYWADKVKW